MWILWCAMVASLGVYLFVALFLSDQILISEISDFHYELLQNVFIGLSPVILILSRYIRRYMLNVKVKNEADTIYSVPRETGTVLETDPVMVKYMMIILISLALSECIGVFGLILFFMAHDLQLLHLFLAGSAIAMYFNRPKSSELKELLGLEDLYSGSNGGLRM